MKLSVCVITYNHERYIRQALDSVLVQRLDVPWEVVVGEDCSTDGTGVIVREYAARHPERIRLLDTPHNLGAFGKHNFVRTLGECRGEYVALLEGDDYWTDPDKLRRQVEFLDANPTHAACFHPVDVVDAAGRVTDEFPRTAQSDFGLDDLIRGNVIPTCSVVFRRGLFGAFPAWFYDCVAGDWPLHLLNARHGRARRLPGRMGAYRVHAGGVWSRHAEAHRLRETVRLLAAARRGSPGVADRAFARSVAVHRWALCQSLVRGGHPTEALREVVGALRSPGAFRHLPGVFLFALRSKLGRLRRFVGAGS